MKTTFEYNKMTVQKRYYHCLILGTFLQSQYFNILNINIITSIFSYSEEIAKYVPIVVKLCYAIAGVVAVVGAISVYIAMNNEEQDVKNILVLQNWLERIRKEVTNKVLSIKRISDFLIFPILAQPTLKKI